MKIPSLIAANFTWLSAKFSFLLAIPLLLGAVSMPTPSAVDAAFTFDNTASLNTARYLHTATLLPNGMVLMAGGYNSGVLTSAELYDPVSGTWTATGSLNTARYLHTATLLPNGKVLVAGGVGSSGVLTSAELYDPVSGTWTATGSLNTACYLHTATLLPNDMVLVAGGRNSSGVLTSAELYDPVSGTWTATGSLNTARYLHTATLLANGMVLVAGGYNGGYLTSAELYDPASGSWTATGSLNTGRYLHTATLLPNGKVLVAGGAGNSGYLTSAELYDPASGSWTATGSLNTARYEHTATLLPNGKVLVAGGAGNSGYLTSAELYDPASGSWTATGSLNTARYEHTATLLPNGKVLVAGGAGSSFNPSASAELYDPAAGTWSATGDLATARRDHTATLLPNGKVLVAGGYNGLSSAELYDPAAGTWSATGALATGRVAHTATLLPNGKVLVAGGANDFSGVLSSAELYDPAAGTWSATGDLATARYVHTATLLPNGKVLVAGGYNGSSLSSAELYDPAAGTWSATGALATGRYYPTATLLPNGKVLVAGGVNDFSGKLSSAELYDPAAGTWSGTGDLATTRIYHTATLLPNGKVLVAGGSDNGYNVLSSAELYDPAAGTWSATGDLVTAHAYHTATLLPNGKVLVAGGFDDSGFPVSSAELYDPAAGTWSGTGALATARRHHTATLLPNGKALVVGGYDNGSGVVFSSAELYDVGLGFISAWQPEIATATSPLLLGSQLILTGSRFQGISQASGGNFQDSSTNYPVVQLRSLDNSQIAFLPVDPAAGWSNTSFASTPVNNFPPGPALVTVFTNGIPSDSKYVVVAPCEETTFYADADGDGYGDPNVTVQACTAPEGYVANNTDCDDTNASTHPGAIEICNGIDDDCDAQTADGSGDPALDDNNACTIDSCSGGSITHTPVNVDDGDACTIDSCDPVTGVHHDPIPQTTWYRDADGDGYGNPGVSLQDCAQPTGYVADNTDCDDTNAAVHPGATEVCDGIDDNCNGQADEGVTTTFYRDADGDGYGDPNVTTEACSAPAGYVSDNTDCNDSNSAVHPGATEVCDGIDNNCDGTTDEGCSVQTQFANISARAAVGTGDNVGIGGFIIHTDPGPLVRTTAPNKRVIIRGIGPSLNIPGQLDDPVLELHDSNGVLIASNDNWGDAANAADIQNTGLAPSNANEAAILTTLDASAPPPALRSGTSGSTSSGAYTAILRGAGGTNGIGLVEVYDLEPTSSTHLANISTRAFVSTGDDVLIGGVIIQGGTPSQVVVRAIGPSLAGSSISNPLLDPILELHDGNGALIQSNDDWMDSQAVEIAATGLAPTNSKESAILATPPAGAYTAIVSGVDGTTGIGLVEAYNIGPPALP